jgi:hypothetical protein
MRFRLVQHPSGLLFEQAFGFPTGEAFVQHIHRQTLLFAQTRGKSRGFLRHFTTRTVEAEREPDDDLPNTVFTGKFAQAAHVFIAIDALEGEQGPSQPGFDFGDGEANAGAPVVHRQN